MALPLATFLIALCALIAIPPAGAQTAQNEGHRNNRMHACLHIQAQVVPVAYTPSARTSNSPMNSAVIYSMPTRQPTLTVVEETHALSARDIVAWAGRTPVPDAVLKTLTIVPQ
jgi:hypothetical protein